MPHIRVLSRAGQVFNFSVRKNRITIGRSKDNDLVLLDHTVSRQHAQLLKTREGYLLTDLGSFNGTKVNNQPTQNALLRSKDQIKIGLTTLIFLTEEESLPSLADSVVLTADSEDEKEQQQIVKSSLKDYGFRDSQELLVSLDSHQRHTKTDDESHALETVQQYQVTADIFSSLERSNKVLFVLSEISRQLNSINDFNELLEKIMDLIFMVIDADYGFLILTGDEEKNELIPMVVKYKGDQIEDGTRLKASRTIIDRVIRDKVALLTSDAMSDSRLDHAASLLIRQIRSAICVPLWKKDKIIGVIQLDSVRFDNQFTEDDLELLKAIGNQMSMIIEQASLNEQIQEEERMRSRLERFHSPQVIEMMLKGGRETKDDIMEPKDVTATMLFADIVGFSSLSEQMPAREINMVLNQFFSRMTDIVFRHDGTLDKYMGDGMMAVFGAPMEKDDDAERAIQAAQEMRRELAVMTDNTGGEKKFNIRMGINTGRVAAGNIGSPKRMDYTVIGEPVNLAARLQSIAEPNQILIGEETYRIVMGKFHVKKVGLKKIKGKSTEVMVYEVLD
jgi:adenylate cyclase